MKTYVITTGTLFGLLTVAHVLRMLMEDAALARDPFYVAITTAAAALCGWSLYVLRRMRSIGGRTGTASPPRSRTARRPARRSLPWPTADI